MPAVSGDIKQLQHLPDTLAFLQLLRDLKIPHGNSVDSGAEELPEVRAAGGLFR